MKRVLVLSAVFVVSFAFVTFSLLTAAKSEQQSQPQPQPQPQLGSPPMQPMQPMGSYSATGFTVGDVDLFRGKVQDFTKVPRKATPVERNFLCTADIMVKFDDNPNVFKKPVRIHSSNLYGQEICDVLEKAQDDNILVIAALKGTTGAGYYVVNAVSPDRFEIPE